jgi:outer membrane lipoprotein-sorting protein
MKRAGAVEAAPLLTKVDYILTAKGSYDYQAVLSVQREGEPVEEKEIEVLVQDPLHRRIIVEKPKSAEGESLVLDGDQFWIYLPKIKKSVRIPPLIAFAGEVSNADLLQPFLSMGYQAVGVESSVKDGIPVYILRLVPRTKNPAYAKIKVWVNQADALPIQAEFFSARNVLQKTCLYQDFKEELGEKRPMRWVYRDAANPANETVMVMKKMTRKNFDAGGFSPQAGPELFSSLQAPPKSTSAPTRPRRRAGR